MSIRDVVIGAIDPAMTLLPDRMDSAAAVCIMLAICGQEADFRHRWQVIDVRRPEVRGPARGLWQFERGGGVRGALTHPASREHAHRVCAIRGVEPVAAAVWPALADDDVLAAAFARLLMWTDAGRLPALGDVEGAWQMYLRTWRPGAWTRGTPAQRAGLRRKWAGYYGQALREVS
ncbi:hypothetical protein [Paracandidimonas soli]|uniref:Uncharacterized protein n=2 Tax=Paracandidimonas soli TaxID=1917182 RepID=A0A4R3UZ95_9BURK|nr:hypothetical protein [Paracandidimonas soli]TCU96118.1 hypothetical protein EV686_107176 [Paracandidimonas soli]